MEQIVGPFKSFIQYPQTLFISSFFFIDKYYRYLEDLYTLTYHEDSSIDQDENESKEIETFNNLKLSTGLTSLQVGSAVCNITE